MELINVVERRPGVQPVPRALWGELAQDGELVLDESFYAFMEAFGGTGAYGPIGIVVDGIEVDEFLSGDDDGVSVQFEHWFLVEEGFGQYLPFAMNHSRGKWLLNSTDGSVWYTIVDYRASGDRQGKIAESFDEFLESMEFVQVRDDE